MNKYINLLFLGFLIFILGLITFNFELTNYEYVDYLPDNFAQTTEEYTLRIEEGKKYEIKRAKYNDNIKISKNIDSSLDDEIVIKISHTDFSEIVDLINVNNKETTIVMSNNLRMTSTGVKDIYNLIIDCIKDKRIYNYNLLKYSEVSIYGNEDVLSRIEIDNYDYWF